MAKPDPRCQINHKDKYIFINVSKNASTSIRNTIIFDIFTDYNTIENPDEYFKFMIIRNPIYRAVSSYLELIKLRGDGPFQITKNSDWFKEQNKEKSFEMFIDFIDGNFYDSHVLPQVNFLKDKNLTIDDVDVKLLHENIVEDFNELISKNKQIKVKSNLANLQVGEAGLKSVLTKFVEGNDSIQDRIREVYSEDVKIYVDIKSK
jgi:hypothetical protein